MWGIDDDYGCPCERCTAGRKADEKADKEWWAEWYEINAGREWWEEM